MTCVNIPAISNEVIISFDQLVSLGIKSNSALLKNGLPGYFNLDSLTVVNIDKNCYSLLSETVSLRLNRDQSFIYNYETKACRHATPADIQKEVEVQVQTFNFTQALEYLKEGKKVKRKDWVTRCVKLVNNFRFMTQPLPNIIQESNYWTPCVQDCYADDWVIVPD